MKRLLLIIACFMMVSSLLAQEKGIAGQVTDDKGQLVGFANILLKDAQNTLVKGDFTQEDGSFVLSPAQNGVYVLEVSNVGFQSYRSDSIRYSGQMIDLGKIVISEGLELEEVTVTAKKPFIEMEADKLVVNVENSSVNAGNSALEVLAKSPGVSVDKDNNISLRGKQGVLVMINGKKQYMSSAEIAKFLESMPAGNIKRIELITNPSAKFDAEGNTGIINIQLKKNENLGFNGSVNGGVRQGQKFTHNGGLNLNYRNEKWNIYGASSYYNYGLFQDIYLARTIPFGDAKTTFLQNSDFNARGLDLRDRIGIDYSINDRTTIGILAKYSQDGEDATFFNQTSINGTNAPHYNNLVVDSDINQKWHQWAYNANLVHNFNDEGTSISFDADYSRYNSGDDNTYRSTYMINDQTLTDQENTLKNDQKTIIDIMAGKLDFTHKIGGNINLESGLKFSEVSTDNSTVFKEKYVGKDWQPLPNRTNQFVYDEQVYAAYVNTGFSVGKASIQAGLRLEHTKSVGESVTLNQKLSRKYTDLFPSISLSHMIGEKHSLSYSYARRLNRPNYRQLNPFVYFLDEFTFNKGNPMLNPQYSHNFGLNYGFGRSSFLSANYSKTNKAITEVIEQVAEENKTYQTNQNLDDFQSASLTLSTSKVWVEWFTSRLNLTGFYLDFTSKIPSGTLDNQSFGSNIYLGNNFSLPMDISAELNVKHQSGLTYALFKVDPRWNMDLGFSKSILGGQGSLRLSVEDIFYTNNSNVSILQDDINFVIKQKNDSRRAKLSFTYNFGNKKVKKARRRKTATEEENNRLGN